MESCGGEGGTRAVVLRTPRFPQILRKNNEPFKDGFLGTAPRVAVFPITTLGALFVSGKCETCTGPVRAAGGEQSHETALSLHPPPARAPEVQ